MLSDRWSGVDKDGSNLPFADLNRRCAAPAKFPTIPSPQILVIRRLKWLVN